MIVAQTRYSSRVAVCRNLFACGRKLSPQPPPNRRLKKRPILCTTSVAEGGAGGGAACAVAVSAEVGDDAGAVALAVAAGVLPPVSLEGAPAEGFAPPFAAASKVRVVETWVWITPGAACGTSAGG